MLQGVEVLTKYTDGQAYHTAGVENLDNLGG